MQITWSIISPQAFNRIINKACPPIHGRYSNVPSFQESGKGILVSSAALSPITSFPAVIYGLVSFKGIPIFVIAAIGIDEKAESHKPLGMLVSFSFESDLSHTSILYFYARPLHMLECNQVMQKYWWINEVSFVNLCRPVHGLTEWYFYIVYVCSRFTNLDRNFDRWYDNIWTVRAK